MRHVWANLLEKDPVFLGPDIPLVLCGMLFWEVLEVTEVEVHNALDNRCKLTNHEQAQLQNNLVNDYTQTAASGQFSG